MQAPYHVLLYYCYTKIEDPIAFREAHHLFCADLGLRGRIIIAREGINGTVSGSPAACNTYREQLQADPRFAAIHFKIDTHTSHVFEKLHVRVKKEIVHADLENIDPTQRTGPYISSQELEKVIDDPEVVLLDVRSTYEHQIGKFKNAITLDISHFREFKHRVAELAPYKEKKIITYCTGGVKCEKASAYLLAQGFRNVHQLHGGIIQYGKDTSGGTFKGSCYVFDNRLTKEINQQDASKIGSCYACHAPCERMVNCANPLCNRHMPLCVDCGETLEGACSSTCQQHPAKRPYNGTGYYVKKTNGYDPYKGIQRKAYTDTRE